MDVAELLILNCADVNAVTLPNVDTPLHLAKSIELAKFLIESGASLTSQNAWFQTPLHCACKAGHVDLVHYFVTCGAYIDAKDQQGRTPLHCCAAGNKDDVARCLIEFGCSIAVLDQAGASALAVAESMGFQEVARVIRAVSVEQRLPSQQTVFSSEK